MKKEKKNEIIMDLIISAVCIVLFAIMFMQFKTIEETDITAIENMRETELRTAIAEWKGKYEEALEQLEENKKSIKEYEQTIEDNGEASELIDKDLQEADMKLGKTDIYGEGIVITIKNTDDYQIQAYDLIDLINELRYAGAEAISINDVRIFSTSYIVQLADGLTLVSDQRVTSPFVIKAIGNQTYLSSSLSLKDSGYIDRNKARGMDIELETRNSIQILKNTSNREVKYMKEAIVIGCILGAVIGIYAPMVPYTYSGYLAIAIIAALDSVFGGIAATLNKNFDLKIFVTGFFGNAILSILLTYLGQKLNVDIYLAAIVVFVGRMFNNLAIIRRYYLNKWPSKKEENKNETEKSK